MKEGGREVEVYDWNHGTISTAGGGGGGAEWGGSRRVGLYQVLYLQFGQF